MLNATVHLVDDDAAIRDALTWLLRTHQFTCLTYDCAEAFLAAYHKNQNMRGCLVLDVRMSGMSGLELFETLKTIDCPLPVIFLTGHGAVPQAVAAIKRGAFDYLEKPFEQNALIARIKAALAHDLLRQERAAAKLLASQRYALLTEREREVMVRILGGKRNKIIADELGIAMRTVEVHRSHIFEKMGVRSAVELSQLLAKAGED